MRGTTMDITKKQAIDIIKQEGKVSYRIVEKLGMDAKQIRDMLEEEGLDRHMEICLHSTDIIVWTKKEGEGIVKAVLNVRPCDNFRFGMIGGMCKSKETPGMCACREMYEECGLKVAEERLQYHKIVKCSHIYSNGDKVLYTSIVFSIELSQEEVLQILVSTFETFCDEKCGTVLVTEEMLEYAPISELDRTLIKSLLEEV